MVRRPCCSQQGLNRGSWSVKEDIILKDYIATHGEGNWKYLPKMAGRLPGRTDSEIKNHWNTTIVKKFQVQQHGKVTLEEPKINQKLSASCVARPKASRWTSITSQPNSSQFATKSVNVHNTNSKGVPEEPCSGDSEMPPQEPYCVDSSCNLFTGDIKIDDGFMSEFLNTELAPLCDLIDGSKGNSSTQMDPGTCWNTNGEMASQCNLFTQLDLEMDNKFMYKFLDTEFAPLYGLIDGSKGVHDYEYKRRQ